MTDDTNTVVGDTDNDNVSYTISKEEYEDFLESQAWLEALEAAGLATWEGYDLAQDIFDTFNRK